MSQDIEFTGERFLPEISGQIAFEHLHRYHFAESLVGGCRVLDVACGEGYGSWILSKSAKEVVGVDIAPDAIAHARNRYVSPHVRFIEASAAKLPFEDGAFDAVVSFETIEHHDLHQEMMAEIKRVLRKGGILIISSPNKQYYSIEPEYKNPFHVKELYREEFVGLIKSYFANALLLSQRVVHGSLLIMENEKECGHFGSMTLSDKDFGSVRGLSKPLYDLLVATDGVMPEVHSSIFEAEVHGLEPARFYGVYLPDRVSKADATILELEQQVRERGLPENEAKKLFESLFGRIDVFQAEGRMLAESLAAELNSNRTGIVGLDRVTDDLRASLDRSIKELANDSAASKVGIENLCRATDDLRANLDRSIKELANDSAAGKVGIENLCRATDDLRANLDRSIKELASDLAAGKAGIENLCRTTDDLRTDLGRSLKDLVNDSVDNKAKIDDLCRATEALGTKLDHSFLVIEKKDTQLEAYRQSLETYRQKLAASDRALIALQESWGWRLILRLRRLRDMWFRINRQK